MVDYKQFNKYYSLLEDFSEEEVIESINNYLKVIPELDYKKVIFTNDNIRTYIDTFQLLEYSNFNKFIDYIIKEYIINKKQLLEVIYNYDIINEKLNNVKQKKEIIIMSETINQRVSANKILNEYENSKLVGKTNKNNLIFLINGEQVKVTPSGRIL